MPVTQLIDGSSAVVDKDPIVLKPSEAADFMKRGCKETKQCFGAYARVDRYCDGINSLLRMRLIGFDDISETCAVGAIIYGIMEAGLDPIDYTLPEPVGRHIVTLNDGERMTREAIADRLMEMRWS